MRNNQRHPILRIIGKELYRFLTDKKILVSILLPGVLIFCLYSLMGDALMSGFGHDSGEEMRVAVIGESDLLTALADAYATGGGEPSLSVFSAHEAMDSLSEGVFKNTGIKMIPFSAVTREGRDAVWREIDAVLK